ncbi:hypothetical protein [Gynurincola endophyticus]|uniref:hypothetical protein n=1 Tax=Gynurincola endophyticus TaxID=2479004 RepID=UPI000F8F2061|nr:hypothetical protein [Gynurincola endophyticus]
MKTVLKILFIIFFSLNFTYCRIYYDHQGNIDVYDNLKFNYKVDYNEFEYFDKNSIGLTDRKMYNTYFIIKLPKKIVNWIRYGNNFWFEYESKQIIYIYNEYKHIAENSYHWRLIDVEDEDEIDLYMFYYWVNKRKYDQKYLYKKNNFRVTKLYTNGKYKILLFNIKKKNYQSFLDYAKTFEIKD